jgi:hypothetical protein
MVKVYTSLSVLFLTSNNTKYYDIITLLYHMIKHRLWGL